MTITVLRSILLCLFIVSIVQAATPVPTPPCAPLMKTLSPEELAPLLQEWDRAMASGKFRDKSLVTAKVTGIVPKGMRYGKRMFVRYNNPEIIDRVIALYLKEQTDYESYGNKPLPPDASPEGVAEYMMFLGEIAESTFDPRIHEAVLRFEGAAGSFQNLYLASVNPEKTLDVLFESKRGPHGRIQSGPNAGKKGHPDYFYHPECYGISVVYAYDILSLMIGQSPEALRGKRARALAFVAKHAKYYSTPQEAPHRPEPVYLSVHDYMVRSVALDVIGVLGTAAEVKQVEAIIHDAREVDLEYLRSIRQLERYGYEQIKEKGERIIKQIRRQSPSER